MHEEHISWRGRRRASRQAGATALRSDDERLYRLLAENASDVVYQLDGDGRIAWASPSVERVLGWRPDQLLGVLPLDLIHPDDVASAGQYRRRYYDGDPVDDTRFRFVDTNGEPRWMEVRPRRVVQADGSSIHVVALRDAHAEVVANRALTTLSAVSGLMVRAMDEHELLADVCAIAVEQGGYRFAWYGRPQDDDACTVSGVAWSVEPQALLERLTVTWDDSATGAGPAGRAVRSRQTVVVDDLEATVELQEWRDAIRQWGFRSAVALPVHVEDELDGVWLVYAPERAGFDAHAVALLEQLAALLGHGLTRLRDARRLDRLLHDQALLTTAIDQAAEAVVVTDNRQRIVYANPAVCRTTGYGMDELLGAHAGIFRSGVHGDDYYGEILSRLRAGQPWHGTMLTRRKDGTLCEEDVTVAPVLDEQGNHVAEVSIRRDLSELRRLEAVLDRKERDQVAIVRLMDLVHAGEDVTETAGHLTEALAEIEDVAVAVVLLVQPDGRLAPAAIAGRPLMERRIGEAIPFDRLSQLLERTKAGPWVADPDDPFTVSVLGPALEGFLATGLTAGGIVALRWQDELVGVLVVATDDPDGPAEVRSRVGLLEQLGAFAGSLLGSQMAEQARTGAARAELQAVIDDHRFHPVFQSVVDLADDRVVGVEALTRFDDGARPDLRIAEAHALGLGVELELACATAALEAARALPPETAVSVNLSPRTVLDPRAERLLELVDHPLAVEITEHAVIDDYAELRAVLDRWGCRVSVDDAGAGYASLRHILELRPHIVKLDIGLVRGIDGDMARQSLVAGLSHFADQNDILLVAEGIEAEGEARVLTSLGVPLGQGYLFGKPAPLRD